MGAAPQASALSRTDPHPHLPRLQPGPSWQVGQLCTDGLFPELNSEIQILWYLRKRDISGGLLCTGELAQGHFMTQRSELMFMPG